MGSSLTSDGDLEKFCLEMFLEDVEIPEVEGSDEIDGIETFEIFF
jgi:hypothetical protein